MKAALSYAHVAEAAGMGTVGTHSLLITPEFGTRVRLACLLTEAPLQTTTRRDPVDDCTHCLDCVKICPVGAISSPGLGQALRNRRHALQVLSRARGQLRPLSEGLHFHHRAFRSERRTAGCRSDSSQRR